MAQAEQEEPDNETKMTLWEHLDELRRRFVRALLGLLAATIIGMCVARELLHLLERPYVSVMQSYSLSPMLQAIGGWAGLGIWMKIAVCAGLVLASPWIFYQLWMFVSAGLRPKERRYVVHAVPWSAALFAIGAAFFLLVVCKPLWHYLIGFNIWLGVETRITIENYVDLTTNLMLVFGLAFQLPLVLYMLGLMGLVNTRMLSKYRRHMVVGIFVFAAGVSSPSGLDMLLLAGAMCVLFELGNALVYLLERKRRRQARQEESTE